MPDNAPHNALRAAVNRAIAEGSPVFVNQPVKETQVKIISTKSVTSTWLGREGTVHCFHFDKSRIGKRVCFHVWKDTGLVDLSVLKGTFWRGDGTERMFFKLENIPPACISYPMEAVAEGLADMYFKEQSDG